MVENVEVVGTIFSQFGQIEDQNIQRFDISEQPLFKFNHIWFIGIPNAVRGEVWSRLLNIHRLKQEQEGMSYSRVILMNESAIQFQTGKYEEMLIYGLDRSRDIRQIDLDVNRTYRNHIMFRERYNTKQQMLFRVLVAYSVYNSVRIRLDMYQCFIN